MEVYNKKGFSPDTSLFLPKDRFLQQLPKVNPNISKIYSITGLARSLTVELQLMSLTKVLHLLLECRAVKRQQVEKNKCILCKRVDSIIIEDCESRYKVLKCLRCGFVYVDPIPSKELFEKAY